jgi:hypothetical protein
MLESFLYVDVAFVSMTESFLYFDVASVPMTASFLYIDVASDDAVIVTVATSI